MKKFLNLLLRLVIIVLIVATNSKADLAEEGQVANLIKFRTKNHFIAEFTEESGHRKDLVNSELFTLDDKLIKQVLIIIGDKLFELERKSLNAEKKELRSLIFGLDQYLLQMQGYKVNGEIRVYVNAVPLTKERNPFLPLTKEDPSEHPPKSLIIPDGGGVYFWQAYVIPDKKSAEIIFNAEF